MNTFSGRMDISGAMGAMTYVPLSFSGPSKSIPKVLPSLEKEWQLAQVWRPVSSSRLLDSPTFRSRQATSGNAPVGRGLITPFSSSEGISGTSR